MRSLIGRLADRRERPGHRPKHRLHYRAYYGGLGLVMARLFALILVGQQLSQLGLSREILSDFQTFIPGILLCALILGGAVVAIATKVPLLMLGWATVCLAGGALLGLAIPALSFPLLVTATNAGLFLCVAGLVVQPEWEKGASAAASVLAVLNSLALMPTMHALSLNAFPYESISLHYLWVTVPVVGWMTFSWHVSLQMEPDTSSLASSVTGMLQDLWNLPRALKNNRR